MSHSHTGRVYSVVAQDSIWPQKFQNVSGQLRTVFGANAISITHVGSTAVPGLLGKPTLDVVVEVSGLSKVDALNGRMAGFGYEAYGAYISANSRFFASTERGARLVNIHVFPSGHEQLERMLLSTAYLITHPAAVMAYEQVKLELYQKFPDDYVAYRAGKDRFLDGLAAKAKAWDVRHQLKDESLAREANE